MNLCSKTANHLILKVKKNNHMNRISIGTVVMHYNTDGNVMGISFHPSINVSMTPELFEQFKTIKGTKDKDKLTENANLVFGQWFSQLNQIELADREKYQVLGQMKKCLVYDNGVVKSCEMEYFFEPIKDVIN